MVFRHISANGGKTKRLKMKTVLLTIALMFGVELASGQSAEDFFNTAANQYVFSKEKLALTTIDQGLSMYPGNKPLVQLKEKILKDKKKKNQNQNQNQNKQQNKDQQKQNKDKQEKKDQQQKDQQQKQEQQKKADEQKDKQDQKQNQQAAQDQEKKDQQDKKNQMPPKSREEKLKELNMSEEKARMILEAMRNNEIQYLQQMKRKATKKPDSGKPDW
jgi:outer membrane biosynthesis protein TonB